MKHSSLQVEFSMQNVTIIVLWKNWASFHLRLSSQLKVTVTFPFITEEKLKHTAEYLMEGQYLWKVWLQSCTAVAGFIFWWHRAWRKLEGHGRELGGFAAFLPGTTRQKSAVTSKTVCHANSTCCSWWRARSAEAQVWQKVSQKLH